MLTVSKYRPPPRCPHCDKPTRFVPSVFGILFDLKVFECVLCGLIVTEQPEVGSLKILSKSVPA